ncbi:MAG: hypothetical protein ACREMY_05300, partial [bacterium]
SQAVTVSGSLMVEPSRELRVLLELSANLSRAGHTEVFIASLETAMACASEYLEQRSAFLSCEDDFLNDLTVRISDLASVVRGIGHETMLTYVWRLERAVAVAASRLPTLGTRQGYCLLPTVLLTELRESVRREIMAQRFESAFQGIRAVGDVGRVLAAQGHCHASARVAEYMAQTVALAAKLGRDEIVLIAKIQLADVAFISINTRHPVVNGDLAFESIVEAYENVLTLAGGGTFQSGDDPITGWSVDILTDRSISSLVRVALFPLDDSDDVATENLELSRRLIELMTTVFVENRYLQSSFASQLYQAALWLVALTDRDLTLELVLGRQEVTLPNERNLAAARDQLLDLIRWHVRTYLRALRREGQEIGHQGELLLSVLSLLALVIQSKRWAEAEGQRKIEDIMLQEIGDLGKTLDQYTFQPDWSSLARFASFLSRERACPRVRRRIVALLRKARRGVIASGLSLYEFDRLRRPIVSFNSTLFATLDRRIFPS